VRVVTWASDRLKHPVTYGDYRTAFGQTIAHHRHYSDGLPDNEYDTTVAALQQIAGTPSLEIPAGRSIFDFPSDEPVVLPATFDNGSIIVRLTINGRGLDFLLDSGASGIFIDPGVAHELGLPVYGKTTNTIGGNYDESRTIVPDAVVGNLHMKNVAIYVSPIDDRHPLAKVVGLLGYDFIASAIVGVNYKDETVTLYPHGSSPTQEVVTKIPVELDDDVPRASASFEGVAGKFLIDTGAFGTLIYNDYFQRLPNHSNLKGTERVGFVGGVVPTAKYTIYNLDFGGVMFKNAPVVVPQSSLADFQDYDGILGRDVLVAYDLYFDYAGQAIYAKYDY
jgi:predicted aspartyl protease